MPHASSKQATHNHMLGPHVLQESRIQTIHLHTNITAHGHTKQHLNTHTSSQTPQAQPAILSPSLTHTHTHTTPHSECLCMHTLQGSGLRMRGFPAWCCTAVGQHPTHRQPDAEWWSHQRGVTEKTNCTHSDKGLFLYAMRTKHKIHIKVFLSEVLWWRTESFLNV